MGKLIPLVCEATLDRAHARTWNRMERHVQLVFWCEEEIERCRRLCPPHSRREFLEILRYFASDRFPMTEEGLFAGWIALKALAEIYANAA